MTIKKKRQQENVFFDYPAADEMPVFVAVNLFVILEHTVTGAGTHEVVVALTGCQAAAHCGTCLVATFTSLMEAIKKHVWLNKYATIENKKPEKSSGFFKF